MSPRASAVELRLMASQIPGEERLSIRPATVCCSERSLAAISATRSTLATVASTPLLFCGTGEHSLTAAVRDMGHQDHSDHCYYPSLPLLGALRGSSGAWGRGKGRHRGRYSVVRAINLGEAV